LCLFILIFSISGCNKKYDNKLDLESLPGKIVLGTYSKRLQEDYNGIIIFTPSLNTYDIELDEIRASDPRFNNENTKIFAQDENTVFEYDLGKKTVRELFKMEDSTYCLIRVVPNSRMISFTKMETLDGNLSENLYLFDTQTKERRLLIEGVYGGYSWDKHGESLLFGSNVEESEQKFNQGVYKYDVESKTKTLMFEGYYPEYSKNNKYIAYKKRNAKNSVSFLVIREKDTGREWEYKQSAVRYYAFSPDDKYIALVQNSTEYFNENYEIVLWDFKNSKVYKLIEKIDRGFTGDFDWK